MADFEKHIEIRPIIQSVAKLGTDIKDFYKPGILNRNAGGSKKGKIGLRAKSFALSPILPFLLPLLYSTKRFIEKMCPGARVETL